MTHDAGAQGLRWPVALVALLAIPFDPWWIDFESARRGLLLVLVGLVAVARPQTFATRALGERMLLALAAWLGVSGLLHGSETQLWPAVERCAWWTSLWLLCRAGAATDKSALHKAMALVVAIAAAAGIAQRLGIPLWIGSVEEPVSLFGNRNVAAEFMAVGAACMAARHAQMPRIATWTLVLCGAYAVANGSRSGLIALPLGVAAACAFTRGATGVRSSLRRWTPIL